MNGCPDDFSVYKAGQGPHGNGGIFEDGRPIRNMNDEIIDLRDGVQRDAAQRAGIFTRLRNLIAPGTGRPTSLTVPGNDVNRTDASQLMRAARQVAKLTNNAMLSREKLANDWENAYAYVNGSSVAETSKWFDFVNSTFKRLVNDRADFHKFVAYNFADPGKSVMNNRIVKEFELMPTKIRGQFQIYDRQRQDLLLSVRPIAERLGMDAEQLAATMGHYATARHMGERNTLLLNRWGAELTAAQLENDPVKVADISTKIRDLRQHINSVDPPEHVFHGGMTNGQARMVMDHVLSLGVTREEAEAFSDRLSSIAVQITNDRASWGTVTPEQARAFPAFQTYVPVLSRANNLVGAVNDLTGYNPGRYEAIQGRQGSPDSAYYTVFQYARRAANEFGMRDFGMMLASMERVASERNRDTGLRWENYSQLTAKANSPDAAYRNYYSNLLSRAIVVDVPVHDWNGNFSHMQRRAYYVDENWTDARTGMTGVAVSRALQNTSKAATGLERAVSGLAKVTSVYSQAFTRFTPAFAVVNTFRDVAERGIHMLTREYYDGNGNRIPGWRLTGSFLVNAPASGVELHRALSGTLDPNSMGAQYWREYEQYGLYQKYMAQLNTERLSLEDMMGGKQSVAQQKKGIAALIDKPEYAGLKQALDGVQGNGKWVLETLDGWNDYFNNLASFNQFVTLRKAGVDPRQAAHGTLELMNLYQTGEWTPILRVLFPFVKPTVQGGMAMMRTLGITGDVKDLRSRGPRAAATILGGYAAVTALLPLLKESMGYDEETGMSRFDQMSLSELQRALPIGDGKGGYAKIPFGFGIQQLIITLAVGHDRVERGLMAPEYFAGELLFTLFDNTSPTGKPNFDMAKDPTAWIMQAISPSVLSGLVQAATNRNYWGGKVTWATNEETKSMAVQGKMSTPKFYHDAAKELLKTTGYDLAPEQLKTLADGLLVGPLRLLRSLYIEPAGETRKGHQEGSARETLGPVLEAFGGTMFYGEKHATNQAMYYNALEEFEGRIRREAVDVAIPAAISRDATAKEAYLTEKLSAAGWDEADIDDYLLLRAAKSALRSKSQSFSKDMRNTWLSAADTSELREQFEALAEQEGEVYASVLNNLNYYNDARSRR